MPRISLTEEVEKKLSELIVEKYPPGTKIPIEPDLMELFGVSRTTIRAAVGALVSRNVLEIRRGDGTYVSKRPGLSEDALGLEFVDHKNLNQDLEEVSKLIQPMAASWAAERADSDDLKQIKKSVDNLESGMKAYENGEITYTQLRQLDSKFHSAIHKSTHNQIIERLDKVFKTYSKELEVPDIKIIENSLLMHKKIYKAIEAKDKKAASKYMTQHLEALNLLIYSKNK